MFRAVDQANRGNCHSLLMHWKEEKADPFMLRSFWVRANETEDPVGVGRAGRPDFLTGDPVLVSFEYRPGLQSGEVRACSRLAIALTPDDLVAGDRRNMSALLFVAAELEDRRAEHREAEATGRRCFDGTHLLGQH